MDFSTLDTEILRRSAPLVPSPAAHRALTQALSSRRLAKGEHLTREGDQSQALYFINAGLLRYYYLADGVEHTGQILDEGMFLADVLALTTGALALQNIDALEPTEVIVIPRAALLAAYDADQAYERFGRRVIEEAMAGSQRRTASLLKLAPEERYEQFLTRRPEIARRIPQYIVASYLGVTPEALSRIRKRRTKS